MKTSVGLVVLVDVPSMGGRVAVLQVRGRFNHEKMGPESYPGCCQVTVHGKCEDEEGIMGALFREIEEELGEKTALILQNKYLKNEFVGLCLKEKEGVINYGVIFSSDSSVYFLNSIRLNASTGGLRFIRQVDIDDIIDIRLFDKTIGVKDLATAMFLDEKEALKLAFEKL